MSVSFICLPCTIEWNYICCKLVCSSSLETSYESNLLRALVYSYIHGKHQGGNSMTNISYMIFGIFLALKNANSMYDDLSFHALFFPSLCLVLFCFPAALTSSTPLLTSPECKPPGVPKCLSYTDL